MRLAHARGGVRRAAMSVSQEDERALDGVAIVGGRRGRLARLGARVHARRQIRGSASWFERLKPRPWWMKRDRPRSVGRGSSTDDVDGANAEDSRRHQLRARSRPDAAEDHRRYGAEDQSQEVGGRDRTQPSGVAEAIEIASTAAAITPDRGDPARGRARLCRPPQAARDRRDSGLRLHLCVGRRRLLEARPRPACSSCCRSVPPHPLQRHSASGSVSGLAVTVAVSSITGLVPTPVAPGTIDVSARRPRRIEVMRDLRGQRDRVGYRSCTRRMIADRRRDRPSAARARHGQGLTEFRPRCPRKQRSQATASAIVIPKAGICFDETQRRSVSR